MLFGSWAGRVANHVEVIELAPVDLSPGPCVLHHPVAAALDPDKQHLAGGRETNYDSSTEEEPHHQP